MIIKKKYKIGGITYKVVFRVLDEVCGEINPVTNTISIDSSVPKTQQEEALFHELVHAINPKWDEVNTQFIAAALYQVLADNKMLR